jgi:hypothetical protein
MESKVKRSCNRLNERFFVLGQVVMLKGHNRTIENNLGVIRSIVGGPRNNKSLILFESANSECLIP